MVAAVDICNRALSEIGSQKTISDLSQPTPAAQQCAMWYDELRQNLLRAAPWGFARYQVALTQLGDFNPDQTSPYPFQWKYAYPPNALKIRYILRQAPALNPTIPFVGQDVGPSCSMIPSRANRYLIAADLIGDGQSKVIISNVPNAIGVFTLDATNPDMFDSLFRGALTAMLAYKLVIPLTGNSGMRTEFKQTAADAVLAARAADGNEAIPTTDYTPDWIAARGLGGYGTGNEFGTGYGQWTDGYDQLNWGS